MLRYRHHTIWRRPTYKVLIDEHMVVLASYDDRSIVGERNVVALVVLHGALQRSNQLAARTEHRQVEVVVIVRHNHLAVRTNTDADWVISHTLSANHSQRGTVICKHLKNKTI